MAQQQPASGHDIVVTTAFELIGVALLAIVADTGKKAGSVIVVLMAGFALIWLMTSGAPFLSKILARSPGAPAAPAPGVRRLI